MASLALPVISRLFPEAKILFARRDPRDVVLSCFRRQFGVNVSTWELLTLPGAARFYDAFRCVIAFTVPSPFYLHFIEIERWEFDRRI